MRLSTLAGITLLALGTLTTASFADHGGALTPADRERIARAVAEARSGKKDKQKPPETKPEAEEKKADERAVEEARVEEHADAHAPAEAAAHGEAKAEPKVEAKAEAKAAHPPAVEKKAEVAKAAEPKRTEARRTPPAPPAPVDESPAGIWKDLAQGNARFVSGRTRTREVVALRKELAKGQHPHAAVLACADSRVGPELVFDKNLGDLFVVRTAGNVADAVALGSLEYAVEHLHVKVLVVLGHEECGAVAASASGERPASPNLAAIVDRIAPAIASLKAAGSSPTMRRVRVEMNAHHSAEDVLKQSPVLRNAVAAGELSLVTAVYGLESGQVSRIDEGH